VNASTLTDVRLAYSVDADDAFMFRALETGAVVESGLRFTHERHDTAALNTIAEREAADVVAVSVGALPALNDRYLVLPHGASVGRGFGPVVVSKRPMQISQLAGARVGVPGLSTTAFMVLRLIAPEIEPVVVPIAPFSRVFEALDAGEVDAALLIHEGRLLFESRGYHQVVELGQWWAAETGLPLPLGVNVIRRVLGPALIQTVSATLREAIAWALSNRAAVIDHIATESRGDAGLRDRALLDRYLGMYANEDTRATAEDARHAISELFGRATSAGLLAASQKVDWAP